MDPSAAWVRAVAIEIVAAGWTAYWTDVIYGLIVVVSIALQAVLRRRLT